MGNARLLRSPEWAIIHTVSHARSAGCGLAGAGGRGLAGAGGRARRGERACEAARRRADARLVEETEDVGLDCEGVRLERQVVRLRPEGILDLHLNLLHLQMGGVAGVSGVECEGWGHVMTLLGPAASSTPSPR